MASTAVTALLEQKDAVDDMIVAVNEKIEDVIMALGGYTLPNGEVITSWKGLLAERDKTEIAIKELIKAWESIEGTKHFVIKVTKSQEYNPSLLREKIGPSAELYIENVEKVNKKDLDKAVKQWAVDVAAMDALEIKSVSVSFKPREDVKDLSVIEM